MAEDRTGIRQTAESDLVLSFLAVRRAIGFLGFFLPLALIAFGRLSDDGFLRSMSAYYYSPMREIFVGTLCAQAVFLWSYKGYRPDDGRWLNDRNLSRAAAIGAAGIALWPTTTTGQTAAGTCTLAQCLMGYQSAGAVHLVAAALFFGAMAVTFLLLFTQGDESDPMKCGSNRIYRLCGWTIILALALIALVQFTPLALALKSLSPVFWLEVVASIAIAIGWSVKGKSLQPVVRMMARRR